MYTLSDHEDGTFTTLREMFQECQGVYISIDCKGGGERLCSEVDSLVKEFRREDITVWGSMFPTNHEQLKKINADVPSFYNLKQVLTTYLLYVFGCLFCCPLTGDIFMTTQFT